MKGLRLLLAVCVSACALACGGTTASPVQSSDVLDATSAADLGAAQDAGAPLDGALEVETEVSELDVADVADATEVEVPSELPPAPDVPEVADAAPELVDTLDAADTPPVLYPVAEGLLVPNPTTGAVLLGFVLRDPSGKPADVAIEVSTDGMAFAPMVFAWGLAPVGPLPTSAQGTWQSFTWASAAQLGAGKTVAAVWVRVTPSRAGVPGTSVQIGPVKVDNGFDLVDETAARLPNLKGDARFIARADFDGDGDTDLALAVAYGASVLLRNDGHGTFSSEPLPLSLPKATTTCLTPFDLDGDGHMDLFACNGEGPSSVLRNDGSGSFLDATQTVLGSFTFQAEKALAADLDGDGDTDLVVLCSGTQRPRLLRNDSGKLTDVTSDHMPDGGLMASNGALGSVDGKGPPDLVFACFLSSQVTRLWLNDGKGTFQDATKQLGKGFESIGMDALLVDLDGDGDLDLFEANLMNLQRVLLNYGSGTFAHLAGALPADLGPYGNGTVMSVDADAGDVDGDGKPDVLLVTSGNTPGANQDLLLRGKGGGALALWKGAPFPEDGGDGRAGVFVDVDGDGDLDVVIANSLQPTRLYVNRP